MVEKEGIGFLFPDFNEGKGKANETEYEKCINTQSFVGKTQIDDVLCVFPYCRDDQDNIQTEPDLC